MNEQEELAERFRHFAAAECRGRSPLYERLCLGVAEDAELLGLMLDVPDRQRRPNLLLATVHDLELTGAAGELGPFLRGERTVHDADPVPHLRALCRRERERIRRSLTTRGTQTNEVARSAAIAPALATVAAGHGPLALLEIGASGGLNLLFDRYRYQYRSATDSLHAGPDSPCVIPVELRGDGVPPLADGLPEVRWRCGLDQSPIDVTDPEQARWLLACVWADQRERLGRLRRALEVAATDPPTVRRGDAVDDLAALAAGAPAQAHLCVLHCWVLAYLDEPGQRRLTAELLALSRNRPVSWIYAEQPGEVPGLPMPAGPAGTADPAATALVRIDLDGGRIVAEHRLADCHPHLHWLAWYG